MWPLATGQPCSLANLIQVRCLMFRSLSLWVFCFLGFLRCDLRRTNEIVRIIQEQNGQINNDTCDLFEQISRTKHSKFPYQVTTQHAVSCCMLKFDTHKKKHSTCCWQHGLVFLKSSQSHLIEISDMCEQHIEQHIFVCTLSSRSPLNTNEAPAKFRLELATRFSVYLDRSNICKPSSSLGVNWVRIKMILKTISNKSTSLVGGWTTKSEKLCKSQIGSCPDGWKETCLSCHQLTYSSAFLEKFHLLSMIRE